MNLSTGFLLYLAVYRLTVLAIGALSIYLGFRLFSQSGNAQDNATDTASADVEAGGFKLSLTNFWPGTYFALFGTVLIGIMLWQNPPQFSESTSENPADDGIKTVTAAQMRVVKTTQMRGKTVIDIDQEWDKLDKPNLTLSEAAEPLSNIARVWQEEKRIGEALAMARLASVYGTQDKAVHLALFAQLLIENGDSEKAVKAMQAAANLEPAYQTDLQALREQIGTAEK